MPEILIRPATAVDVERLCAVAARTFRETYRPTCDPGEVEDYVRDAFTPEAVGAWLDEHDAHTLLALLGSEVVGYARVRRGATPAGVDGPEPVELVRLYVDATLHGRGIGAALMRACLDSARALGARTIWLGAYEENRRALAFYADWGFVPAGTRPFEFGGRIYADPVLQRALSDDGLRPSGSGLRA